jgi:hypothetical protein
MVRGDESRASCHDQRDALVDELAGTIAAQIRRVGQFTITTEVAFLTATKE